VSVERVGTLVRGTVRRVKIADGTTLGITLFRRNPDDRAPLLAILPGMGVEASYYLPLAQALVGHGVNVATVDLRGLGLSSVRAARDTDFGFREILTLDFPAVLEQLETDFPGNRPFLLGHSLGGPLGCLYAAIAAERLSGLVLAATPSAYFRGWRFPLNLGVYGVEQVARALTPIFGYWPGDRLGFAGREARGVISDWAYQGRTGRYRVAGDSRDFDALLAGVKLPVLALSFTDDMSAPARAVDHLVAKMPACRLTRRHLSPRDVGARELGHFKWARQSDTVAPLIADWVCEAAVDLG
jgi:predicted alpha/beta hydrolase